MNVHFNHQSMSIIRYIEEAIGRFWGAGQFLEKKLLRRLSLGTFSILVSLVCLIGCDNNKQIYRHFISFPSYVWYRDAKLVYKVPISSPISGTTSTLTLRHATEFPYHDLRIVLTITSPSGKQVSQNHTIPVLDADSNRLGKGLGDYWDVKYVLQPSTDFLEIGTYEYEISHDMADAVILLTIDMGLTIEKISTK